MRASRLAMVAAFAAVCSCVCMSSAFAQDPEPIGVELSAHGAAVVPLGDWGDESGVSIGAWVMGRYALPVDGLAARARLGFLYGIPRRDVIVFMDGSELVIDENTLVLPLMLGVDYALPVENLSVHAEFGVASFMYSADIRSNGAALDLGNERNGLALDFGATYDLDVVRVGLDALLVNVGGDVLFPGIMLTVGLPLLKI